MAVEVTRPGVITRVCKVVARRLLGNGALPDPVPDGVRITGVSDVPLSYTILQGEQSVDRADGVGVINVHEEDDTLIGVDLDVVTVRTDFVINALILGGTVESRLWLPPTITEQRDTPVRFSLDVYSRASKGRYLVYRYHFCKGASRNVSRESNLVAISGFVIKARPHPITQRVYHMELVDELPNY